MRSPARDWIACRAVSLCEESSSVSKRGSSAKRSERRARLPTWMRLRSRSEDSRMRTRGANESAPPWRAGARQTLAAPLHQTGRRALAAAPDPRFPGALGKNVENLANLKSRIEAILQGWIWTRVQCQRRTKRLFLSFNTPATITENAPSKTCMQAIGSALYTFGKCHCAALACTPSIRACLVSR